MSDKLTGLGVVAFDALPASDRPTSDRIVGPPSKDLAPMSDHSNDWVGRTLSDGRYRVDAKLGEGGMGFVYKVWDRNLDTDVVVKAPRKSMLDDPEFARRFALEIRSLVQLSHPNIVKVSDVGEHEGLPFAVMQYLSGGTLDERQEYGRDGRPLPAAPASLAGWLPGMAAALDFIHGRGYIHRDVKPANILFDTHGHPYLSDFGVAKVLSDVEAATATSKRGQTGMTGIGIVLGTPDYMAPELIMGVAFDGRVDQYALAATAYEILCGRKPFWGETATAVLVRQTTQAPPPMVELPELGGEAISRVILKGLAKKPGERFATCSEFAAALVPALAKAGLAKPLPADRLSCPGCGLRFALPPGATNYGGKKSKCRACGTPFRIAMDGLSLQPIDLGGEPGSSSGSVEIPISDRQPSAAASVAARSNRTTAKLDAIPGLEGTPTSPRVERTMKMEARPSAPRAEPTMKLEARPGPARVERTMKLEAMPVGSAAFPEDSTAIGHDEAPTRSSALPWVIGGVGVAAAAILGLVLALRPSTEGTVQVLLDSPVAGAKLWIDGEPVDPDQLDNPLKLSVGDHQLEAGGRGLVHYKKGLKVAPGLNPVVLVKLAQVPAPPPLSPAPPETAPPTVAIVPPSSPPPPPPSARPPGPGFALPGPAMPSGFPQAPDRPPVTAYVEDEKPEEEAPRPVHKKGQLKAHLTLKELVSDPKEHLDELVSPSDLVLVGAGLVLRPGLEKGLAVRSKDGAYQVFQKNGSPIEIVLKADLADHLREQLSRGVIVAEPYPAILQMRIVADRSKPGGYLGVVEWLEFLYYINPIPLSVNSSNFKNVFNILAVTDAGHQVGHSRSYKEWEARLRPLKVVPSVRNSYMNANRPPIYEQWATQAMKPDFNTSRFFHAMILKQVQHIR